MVNLVGGPYACGNYRARARVVFQNKNVMCQYRAVGHPIATAVTEGLVDLAAARSAWTRRSCGGAISLPTMPIPATRRLGIKFEKLSHHASLAQLWR